MTTETEAEPGASPFASAAALREAHTDLLLSVRRDRQDGVQKKRIHDFIERAQATGRRVDAPADREAAQNILMYWASQLYAAGEKEALNAGLPLLDPFDPRNAPDLSKTQSPFHGLSAYGESEAKRFVGRGQAVGTLLDKLREQRLILVLGPTGSGKTSLVYAGVLPALKARLAEAGSCPVILSVAPGAHPVASLLKSASDARGAGDAEAWFAEQKQKLDRSPEAFASILETTFPDRPAVLIVDPFSELFALCHAQEEREAFCAAVVSASRAAGGSGRVILVIDERYRQQAFQLAALKPLQQNGDAVYFVPPLAPADIIRTVTSAADTVGLKFDDGVLEDLARDIAGNAGGLPLLQFALDRLWDERQGDRIAWDAYRRVGRPREALERTAESVFAGLSAAERTAARDLFLQMVRPAESASSGVNFSRLRVRRDALDHASEPGAVMKALEDYQKVGLVRMIPGGRPEDDCFEVAHEALADAWPRLRGWLREDREASQKISQLAAIARRWQESGSEPRSGYLLSGGALEDAEAHAREAPPVVGEFVSASRREVRRRERQASRIQGAVIVLLLALLAFAGWQWRRASVQATRASEEAMRADSEAASARQSAVNAFDAVNRMLDVISVDRQNGTINVKAAGDILKSAQAIVAAVNDRPELRKARVDLLLKISDMDLLAGDQEAALKGLQEADRLLQGFLADDPTNADWLADQYQVAYKSGDIRDAQGKDVEAISQYERAMDIRQKLARVRVEGIDNKLNASFMLNKIGDGFIDQRQWDVALKTYAQSLAIGEGLVKDHPDDPRGQKSKADALARMAYVFLLMHKFEDARKKYVEAIEIQEALVKAYPTRNDVYLSNLSRSYSGLGTTEFNSDHIAESLRQYRLAQQTQKRLANGDKTNTEWQVALAKDDMSIGNVCSKADEDRKPFDLTCAEDNYSAAVDIRDTLANKAKQRKDWQAAAAASHLALGTALAQDDKLEAAAGQFRQEAEYRIRLASTDATSADYQFSLADAFGRLGDALARAGNDEDALDAYKTGASGLQAYLAAKPDDKLKGQLDSLTAKVESLTKSGQ